MVIDRLDLTDVIQHPTHYDGQHRLRALEFVRRLLLPPMSPSDAADELLVSKQTVHAWLKDGYLAEAPGSKSKRRLLDRGDVYAAADLLRQARAAGQLEEERGSLISVLRAAYANEPETATHLFTFPDLSIDAGRSVGAKTSSANPAAKRTRRRRADRPVASRRARKAARAT
jgi:DNA-binding transcriptional MerR regulator